MLFFLQNNEEEIVIPVLNIQDSKTGENVPVRGIQGEAGSFIQTVALQNAPLVFQPVSSGEYVVSAGYSKAVVSLRFSSSSDSADIRFLKGDANGTISASKAVTVNATQVQDGGSYVGEEVVFDCLGAKEIAVLLESGSAEIYIAVV